MKCLKCGIELPDNVKFCNMCGAMQSTEPVQPAVPAKPEAPAQPETPAKPEAPAQPEAPAKPEAPAQPEVPTKPEAPAQDPGEKPPKSRFVYQVLAVFLGSLGIHNFYAGRTGIAITQLLISCTGASSIWALIEILAIKKDGSGRPMTVGGQNPKSRNKYRWLAFFLGAFGIHDFYAGRIVPGFIHLVISCTGIGFVISAVWAFVEIFAVKKDSEGVVMPLKKDKLFTILSLVFLVIGLGIWGYKEIMNLRFFWGVSALLFYPYALALLFGFLALIGGRLVPFLAALLIPVATIGTSILLDNNPERQAAFRADMFKRRVARDIARGIEFDARAETLVRCPANFSGEYTVPYEVKRIEKGAFEGCTQLTAVTINHNVYTIGENAFKGCTGLKEVKIEKHVIKRHAYHNWTSTHSEYKPEGRSLYGGHSDDSEWYNDRDVSVREIGARAFEGCTKLNGVVYVPRGVYLGENAFKGCPCKIERW